MLKFCQGYSAGQTTGQGQRVSGGSVRRYGGGRRSVRAVRLQRCTQGGFGLVLACDRTCVLHGAFVQSVAPGSPAEAQGVGSGDQIMSINGRDVQNDSFLTVVDLLQFSNSPVELVIAKGSKESTSKRSSFTKMETSVMNFKETDLWKEQNEFPRESVPNFKVSDIPGPVPMPRKKWSGQKTPCSIPDLTLDHLPHVHDHNSWNENSDCCDMRECPARDNIPDIIASQMKHIIVDTMLNRSTESLSFERSEERSLEDTSLLPGEVFHVVLDKTGGSLGLNIYQGSECGEQRYVYIHSVIKNGAADIDGRIKSGDKLIEVNGSVLENLSYQEIVTKLRESPQVAHLVLEKGHVVETKVPEDSILANVQTSKSNSQSLILNHFKSSNQAMLPNNTGSNGIADQHTQSLTSTSSEVDSAFQSSRDIASELSLQATCESDSKYEQHQRLSQDDSLASPRASKSEYLECQSTPYGFKKPLVSYNSTPNLLDNSDEEDADKELGRSLYRNLSTDCIASPHFMQPHKSLVDAYHNYQLARAANSHLPVPPVPLRKKKLKKVDDIFSYCDSGNTFSVCIRKSSRGLGLSISGGTDIKGRNMFSKLIRIRKLYPLQPALECGKLQLGDVILEVNGTIVVGLSNTEALELLRCAPADVVLKVFRPSKSLIPAFSTLEVETWSVCNSSSSSASSSLSRSEKNAYSIEINDFEITLEKCDGSLGFTIYRKDGIDKSQDGIYVKDLVRPPAISDGRILPGDRILKVNGVDMSSLSNAEAIDFLRGNSNTVTLTLYRSQEPPSTPGYVEDYSVSKPLRWEALELLSDRKLQKDDDSPKRRLKKRVGDLHKISGPSLDTCDDSLQRNLRPKSMDTLNSSERSTFQSEESFHRQSSVMHTEEGSKEDKGKNLLKWRGSILPHSEDEGSKLESDPEDEKPVPFPRTTSCEAEWVHTLDVDLDRGWHGRLGFSLCDPLPKASEKLPTATQVKAVYHNSLAEKDGRIRVGDRLLEVNQKNLIGKSAFEVIDMLRKTRGVLKLVICRLEKRA